MIKLIACVSSNFALGKDNDLLFKIEEDMQRFRKFTENNIVLMGRKTYDSIIEMNGKPLPKRVTVILTRDKNMKPKKSEFVFNSVESIVNHCQTLNEDSDKTVWVCGGAESYKALLPYVKEIRLTIVDKHVEDADTFYPIELQESLGFTELEDQTISRKNVGQDLNYEFKTYVRG